MVSPPPSVVVRETVMGAERIAMRFRGIQYALSDSAGLPRNAADVETTRDRDHPRLSEDNPAHGNDGKGVSPILNALGELSRWIDCGACPGFRHLRRCLGMKAQDPSIAARAKSSHNAPAPSARGQGYLLP